MPPALTLSGVGHREAHYGLELPEGRKTINAYMNIQVRVLKGNAAAQIKQLQAEVAGLTAQLAKANAISALGGRQISALSKFGNQLQWTGRQLQYNFTLPLAIAGAAATKWAMDNEQAFTRIRKVYGDGTQSAKAMENELNALKKAFVALSNQYGVQQSQVLNIAADWAAAGASGIALARGVEQTLKTMVLGEMDAAAATEALIAIQAQYNLSSSQLADTINELNIIENQTGIQLPGLIQGFARAAGVARSAGVDVEHLGAMLAALVPTSGSAAQAGNALKTILSRLSAPTNDMITVLGRMHIEIDKVAWKSANGSQKLELLAKKFHGLSDAQKGVVASTIASRYQVNKFITLMDQIYKKVDGNAKTTSYYAQALDATADKAKVLKAAEAELAAVLKSNPQKFKQIWVILQNAMSDIIIPLIPVILMAADTIRRLVEAFRDLPLPVQKAITFGLLFLALFGPLIRYIGSTMTLIGELGWFFGAILYKGIFKAIGAMLGFAALPFKGVAGGLALIGKGYVGMIAGAGKAARATIAFLSGLTLFRRMGPLIGMIISGMATGIAQVWTQGLRRMAMITGPALAAVQQIFIFWRIGMARTMALVGAMMNAAWTVIVTGSRWVGPMLAGSWRATWAALVALTKFGTTAMVIRFKAMGVAIWTFFTNFRLRMVGGFAAMWAGIGTVTKAGMMGTVRMFKQLPKLLASPWTLAVAAVVTVLLFFRKQIAEAIHNVIDFFGHMPPAIGQALQPVVKLFHEAVKGIIKAFYALPEGVRNAMIAVVRIVKQAAMAVYKLFSYLNPFAHHSPSLVENVRNGMAVVRSEFAKITDIEGPIKKAYRDIKAFGKAIAGLIAMQDRAKQADDRALLAKFAPGAIDEYNRMIANLKVLTPLLNQLSDAIDKQQGIVDGWKAKLDAANATLDAAQKRLDELQAVANAASDNLQAAQASLDKYANTPIQGMKAMEDQIFANEMAQKKLRLEMLKMDEAVGGIDKLKNKMDALAGQIELVSGEQQSLRAGGAGSEILKQYDDQIKGLEKQQDGIKDTVAQYDKLSDELDKLQTQGEKLDLEKSLKFDELTKQINDAAHAMQEMPFDEIMAGIQQANADIAKYSDEVEKANAAVDAQKAAVDAATAARDAIQASYDAESAKLEKLRQQYSDVESAIQDINTALQEMTTAAEDAIRRQQDAMNKGKGGAGGGGGIGSQFDAAAGGNFPGVGGSGGLGRDFPGIEDQSAMIDQFTQDIAKQTQDLFGSFDIFGPIKEKWNQFTGWWKSNVNPAFAGLGSAIGQIWDGTLGKVDWLAPFKGIDWAGSMGNIKSIVQDAFGSASGLGKKIWKLFADDLKEIWQTIKDKFQEAVKTLGPEIDKFKGELEPITESMKRMWPTVKMVAMFIGGALLLAFKILTSILKNTVGPVLDGLIGIIKGFIKIIRGWIEIITGIINGDFGRVWEGVKTVWSGTLDAIIGVVKAAWGVLWGTVKGIVVGIWDFFVWLKDELVGHSVVPDMINAIIDWIASLPSKAWNALKDLGSKIISIVKAAWDWWVKTNGEMWDKIWNWLKTLGGKAKDAISDLVGKLRDKAKEAWEAFKNKSGEVWDAITGWIKGLPGKAGSAISNIVGILKDKGHDAMTSMKTGLTNAWDSVSGWLGGIGSKIKSAIGDLGDLLYNVGKSILDGLLSGLKHAWEDVKSFVTGIGPWIKQHKGPIETDRKLLIPAGDAIMTSLKTGLQSSWPDVQRFTSSIGPAIASSITKSVSVGRLGGLVGHAEARVARAEAATRPVTYGNTTYHTEIHIHGDLSFPNIKSGDDADSFISHLENLAGGR